MELGFLLSSGFQMRRLKKVSMASLDYDKIPVQYMLGGVQRYFENRIPPGDFLTAVICNDLKEAFIRADDDNTLAMHAWVSWFYNEAPAGSWGSPEAFKNWLAGE